MVCKIMRFPLPKISSFNPTLILQFSHYLCPTSEYRANKSEWFPEYLSWPHWLLAMLISQFISSYRELRGKKKKKKKKKITLLKIASSLGPAKGEMGRDSVWSPEASFRVGTTGSDNACLYSIIHSSRCPWEGEIKDKCSPNIPPWKRTKNSHPN